MTESRSMEERLSELPGQDADPDAQATLTDFLDYTEFFPSDLFRSLTLIGSLDEAYTADAQRVHELTKTYGALPTLSPEHRPHPKTLRKDISIALDHAIRQREASLAEASRLCNVADALYEKLVGIKAKLVAMPNPPSRDPTPPPQPKSPMQSRNRKRETERSSDLKAGREAAAAASVIPKAQKNRQRRIVVPGEPLPPYDPASPGADISSESESERATSIVDTIRVEPFGEMFHHKVPKRLKEPKDSRPPRAYSMSGPLPKVRPRGVYGTNVHSQVAGISVSNAMASLTPPPEDPLPGSEWAPWLELTDWELNILRRRMKKNANWTPSDTMKRRTLAEKGRGHAAYHKAKEDAEQQGVAFLNEKPHVPGRKAEAIGPGMEVIMSTDQPDDVVNRGMKLNEQKKLKQARDIMASTEQQQQSASQGHDADELTRMIDDAHQTVSRLLGTNGQLQSPGVPVLHSTIETAPPVKIATRKRRLDAASSEDTADASMNASVITADRGPAKRPKLKVDSSEETDFANTEGGVALQHVPLAPEGPSSPRRRGRTRAEAGSLAVTPAGTSSEQPTTAATSPKSGSMQPPPVAAMSRRPSSRSGTIILTQKQHQKAASAEPPSRKISLRRSSNVSLPASNQSEAHIVKLSAPGRRGRKPTPGFPKTQGDEATTVSSHRRKAKPGKPVEKNIPVDEIDPDEPRYCICNDVSWGDMVACENGENCEGGEWFHFACVGLMDHPPRRQKWYCPVCRAFMGVDAAGAPASKQAGRAR